MLSTKEIIKAKHFEKRGTCFTSYDYRDFHIKFVQDKVSTSVKGTIRGFHSDSKTWKLISCLHGRIKLVTYDIYNDTKESYYLSSDDLEFNSVLIPPGTFNAHQCLTNECVFFYKWSEYYTSPEDQWSIYYNDSTIDPNWEDIPPIVSSRDKTSKSLMDFKKCISKT
tara:strand:- start:368 stop:868 length:501 start_codon:yes stop_codon:yes gene_type:complete